MPPATTKICFIDRRWLHLQQICAKTLLQVEVAIRLGSDLNASQPAQLRVALVKG
jgi:hypothetical protein